ncbi:MAG: hypothetical protein Q8N01_06665 [Sulfuricurvum sp.]|nr:hypothetical protein [Sulfuricurvum sp.]
MKKETVLYALAIILVTSLDVFATDKSENSIANEKMLLLTKDGIEIGLQSYWYKYEEEVNGAFFMSNTGNKYGVSIAGTKSIGDNYYFIGNIRYATGDVEYKSASGTGDVSDNVGEGRLIVGNEVMVNNYLLSSYIGVGYRRLDNDLRDLGSGGYRRTSQYWYIPIGITHRFIVNDFSRVSTSIEYNYLAKGEQKSYLSDVGPAYARVFGDPVNKQKKGYGLHLNTAYEMKHWSLGTFLNYWKIGDSEINYYVDGATMYGVYEPKNVTTEFGIQVKYRF